MHFWLVTLVGEDNGERNLSDPTWIVVTFGGDSESELNRQREEAMESVFTSGNGPPKQHLEQEKLTLEVDYVEFDAMGVARL